MKSSERPTLRSLLILAMLVLLTAAVIFTDDRPQTRPYPVYTVSSAEVDFSGAYQVNGTHCATDTFTIVITPVAGEQGWYRASNIDGSDEASVYCQQKDLTLKIPEQPVNILGQEVVIRGGAFRSGQSIDLFFQFKSAPGGNIRECHIHGKADDATYLYASNTDNSD